MISVVINNYNYGRFLGECIDSVLAQTVTVDEIVVVDDGSKDDSREILNAYAAAHERVKVICKANGGQLSAINEGFLQSRGDLVFFLDADDRYAADHVEKVAAVYARYPSVDYVFCAMQEFGNRSDEVHWFKGSKDIGFSFFRTAFGGKIIGGATSTVSMRRKLLKRFLPVDNEERWTLCADTCLNVGSSIFAARKYYLDEPLVFYRVHGNNNYITKTLDYFERHLFRYETGCLIGYFLEKSRMFCDGFRKYLLSEFITTTTPRTKQELHEYRSICDEIYGPSLQKLALKYKLTSAFHLKKYKR